MITLQQLQEAFDKAEEKTAEHYNQQTCSMLDSLGNHSCPICHFRIWVKHYLGILSESEVEALIHKK